MSNDALLEVQSLIEDADDQLNSISRLIVEESLRLNGQAIDDRHAIVLTRLWEDYRREWWVYARLRQIRQEISNGERQELSPSSVWDEVQAAIDEGDRDVWLGWMEKRDQEVWTKIKSSS